MLVDVWLSPIVWSGLVVVDAIFFAWSSGNKVSVSSLACELEVNLNLVYTQKYSRLRCLLRVKGLVIGFYLGWSGHTLLIRKI